MTGVRVFWPDGKTTTHDIKNDASEVTVYYDGRIE
jgi:hypothetical protein